TYYYIFNTKKAPFVDVRVRQAISYATDRNIVTDAILAQGQEPVYFLKPELTVGINPDIPDYGKMTQEERNAEAARQLEEAGDGAEKTTKGKLP
ncbi:hypothetical protein UP25_06600, partial [Vibrio parahaemolyticus]